jgi:anti-sigma28 factor (negative regulator of flagellin synthesis)
MASAIQGTNGTLPEPQVDLVSAVAGTGSAGNSVAVAAPATPPPATDDSTDISALSAILANAVAAASAQSSIRPPLVASIKAQIAAGMYGPSLSSVADAIARALAVS